MPDLKSPILSLPYIASAQAQKHVTHNEALAQLDLLVQLSVLEFDAVTPPAVPVEGDVYALGTGATDEWAGQLPGTLAAYLEGFWNFTEPRLGWVAGEGPAAALRVWDGSAWVAVSGDGGFPGSVESLGINATADALNRLSINAEATLLNHEGSGHQLKLNKASATDTASLLFQTDFSGRAEMGTAGEDDFSFKVSQDGVSWNTSLTMDGASGNVSFPSGAKVPCQVPVSGRWLCNSSNSWVGFNSQLGWTSGNFATTLGSGSEPDEAWSHLGLPLSGGTRLNRWLGTMRVNSTEVTALDIRLCVQYGLPDGTLDGPLDLTRDTVWSEDGRVAVGTSFWPIDADLGGYIVPRDAVFMLYIRGVGAVTANRYAYVSTSLRMVLD